MEWTELIVHYGAAAAVYVDELTKTDLMILLSAFLLGHYVGSKKNVGTKDSGV